MYVGNIHLPAMNTFKPGNISRKNENIYPLGSSGVVVAEFESELPRLKLSGNILQTYGGSRTLYQLKEDIEAIRQRRAGYNYVHDAKGRSGFITCTGVDVDDEAGVLWPVSIDGQWLDKGDYVMQLTVNPITRTNDWDIEGSYKMRVPYGYSAFADTVYGNYDVSTEDGTIKEVAISSITSLYADLSGDDTITGKCKCYDGSIPVYSTSHVFSGQCSISNGLYQIIFNGSFLYLKYWNGSWQTLTTLSINESGVLKLVELTNDNIVIKKGTSLEIEMEFARVPHIHSTRTIYLSASDGSTSTDNYLSVGTNVYVASTVDFSISGTALSCEDMWFFYASSDVASAAHNAIVKSNLKRRVVSR